MRDKRGNSVQDRIRQYIDTAKNIDSFADRILSATKALGAIDFALEFGLITYKEWDKYVSEIFDITA